MKDQTEIFRKSLATLALLLCLPIPSVLGQTARVLPPAFGPYVNLTEKDFTESKSFRRDERIVGTYFFYWYDIYSKEHIIDGDGSDALTTHPRTLEDFSYKSVRWHKRQLQDMMAAGIDLMLPVFWGAPSEHDEKAHLHWSYAGLKPLVQAREELLREGQTPPRIGLFYDTSTLRHNAWGEHIDLTTDFGQRWFYATIRDFFSLIPARHWAMIDNQPIVLLYSAAFAKNHDQRCLDFVKKEFPKEFAGRVPYVAREISWRLNADNTCAWGGALGLKNPGIASVGPGYDHSAVPGRQPLIVPRAGGKFYEDNWLRLLRRPSNFVMVETWNEFHEGTDVCESQEYGRQFIELTRKYSDLFKKGWQPAGPAGPYSNAKSVAIQLGQTNQERGLSQVENDDGQTTAVRLVGREARVLKRDPKPSRYVYFKVDDSFKWTNSMEVMLKVEYFDDAAGTLAVEFDGSDSSAPFNGAYSRCVKTVPLNGSKTWKTGEFRLTGARFRNSQNRGADFRLAVDASEIGFREVTLSRSR